VSTSNDELDALCDAFQEWRARQPGRSVDDFLAEHPGHPPGARQLLQAEIDVEAALIEAHRQRGGQPPSFEARPGVQIGSFRLLELIAHGGMGQVWQALELPLGRVVALKLLRTDPARAPRYASRLEREALAAGRLRHPGIVAVLSAGHAEGVPWLAQEYVPGGRTLADLVRELWVGRVAGAEDYRRLAALLQELALALHHAHLAGVVHRDVTPRNVLLAEGDHPRLADFGLARVRGELTLTRSGEMLGTYDYMSPEQATGKHADATSDQFAFGAVMYELLTGRRPFQGDTDVQVLAQVRQHDPTTPEQLRSKVPADLSVICMRCLEKRPTDRYRSMAEAAEDLGRYLRHEPIRARPTGRVRRAIKWARRHPTATALLVLGCVALAVTLILLEATASSLRAAESSLEESRRQTYLGQIRAAALAVAADDVEQAREWLAGIDEDARGWEYRHVQAACDAARAQRAIGQEGLSCAALSREGRLVVLGGQDGSLTLWDVATETVLRTLPGHASGVDHIVVDAPGRFALTSDSLDVRAWDLSTGEQRGLLDLGDDICNGLALSPDGALGLVATNTRLLLVELPDGRLRSELVVPEARPSYASGTESVTFTADGRRAISGALGVIHLWDVATGSHLARLGDHAAPIVRLIVIGNVLVAGDSVGVLSFWDLDGPTLLAKTAEARHQGAVSTLAASHDLALVASGSEDRSVRLWDLEGHLLDVFMGHRAAVTGLAFLDERQRLVSASEDGTLHRWSLERNPTLRRPAGEAQETWRGHAAGITGLMRLPDHGDLLSTSADGSLRRWEPNTRPATSSQHFPLVLMPVPAHEVVALALSADGSRLALALPNEVVSVWDTGRWLPLLVVHASEVGITGIPGLLSPIALALDASGRRLFTGGRDERVLAWDVDSGALLAEAREADALSALALSPDGSLLACATESGALHWRSAGDLQLLPGQPPEDLPRCTVLRFSPAGDTLVSGHHDGSLRVWAADGTPRGELPSHDAPVSALAFAPNGDLFASAAEKGGVHVLAMPEGKVHTLGGRALGHEYPCSALVFLDQRRLASLTREGALRLVDLGASPTSDEMPAVALRGDLLLDEILATGTPSDAVFDGGHDTLYVATPEGLVRLTGSTSADADRAWWSLADFAQRHMAAFKAALEASFAEGWGDDPQAAFERALQAQPEASRPICLQLWRAGKGYVTDILRLVLQAYLMKGNIPDSKVATARSQAEALLAFVPDEPIALALRGLIEVGTGQPDAGLADLMRSEELLSAAEPRSFRRSDLPLVMSYCALARAVLGDHALAAETLARARRLSLEHLADTRQRKLHAEVRRALDERHFAQMELALQSLRDG